jgi:hypothetical protein
LFNLHATDHTQKRCAPLKKANAEKPKELFFANARNKLKFEKKH